MRFFGKGEAPKEGAPVANPVVAPEAGPEPASNPGGAYLGVRTQAININGDLTEQERIDLDHYRLDAICRYIEQSLASGEQVLQRKLQEFEAEAYSRLHSLHGKGVSTTEIRLRVKAALKNAGLD